ncbi:patatin-like phospholipase family protein [uncultured Fibrella sp.]|uniref:patatin-like phospholipase family protein n=1 Tax=uncultured Fibrella sp. TaxID=1284596 RepID=UPI0035CA84B2
MKKILSIDGGGIRGIIPGRILVELEAKLQVRTQNPQARLADFFDFFAGTSTGGILTCLYLCPDKADPAKSRFSAQEAVDLYVKKGGQIFDTTVWHRIRAAGGILEEKYDAAPLEKLLKRYFGDVRLSQLRKPCIIPAYDIKRREAHFFAQHDFAKKGSGSDFLIRDVARATSAAPTYFEVASIDSLSHVSYPLVDGGVFANNPALCAYSEVRNAKKDPKAADMMILSIGTGSQNRPYDYDVARNWGQIGWVQPVIDIMMAGAAETTDYHLTRMFSAVNQPDQYIRLQPANLGDATPDMDNASEENIKALLQVGTETAQNCHAELDRIVEMLVKDGPDPVLF